MAKIKCPQCGIEIYPPIGPECPKCYNKLAEYELKDEYVKALKDKPVGEMWDAMEAFFKEHPVKGTMAWGLKGRRIKIYSRQNPLNGLEGDLLTKTPLFKEAWNKERAGSFIKYLRRSLLSIVIVIFLVFCAYHFFAGKGGAGLFFIILLLVIGPIAVFGLLLKFFSASIGFFLKAMGASDGGKYPNDIVKEYISESTGLMLGSWDIKRMWISWGLILPAIRAADKRLSPENFRQIWASLINDIKRLISKGLVYDFRCVLCGKEIKGHPSFYKYASHNYKEARAKVTGVVTSGNYIVCADCAEKHDMGIWYVILEPSIDSIAVYPDQAAFNSGPEDIVTMSIPVSIKESMPTHYNPERVSLERPYLNLSFSLKVANNKGKGKWYIVTPFTERMSLLDADGSVIEENEEDN